jgi:hypothetical protein
MRNDHTVNGELAEVICLATHGTAWLAGGQTEAPDLEQSNSTFQFVGEVSFRLPKRSRLARDERAASVRDWLERRRSAGIERLYLVIPGIPSAVDQHSLAAFANAGQWGLLGVGKRSCELWHATWTVGDREAADRRIWFVDYEGTRLGRTAPQHVDPHSASRVLRQCLEAAARLAEDVGEETWAEWFRRALSPTDELPYHPDMLPTDYDAELRQLVAMAAQSWVFGGMGSWNDLGFSDADSHRRYQEVTRRLYDAVLRAFVAGVNHPA